MKFLDLDRPELTDTTDTDTFGQHRYRYRYRTLYDAKSDCMI